MFHSSVRWVLSLNWLSQKWGQVHSDATFYHWKAKYGGLEVSEARRLRQLEDENGRLKKIVAQQALDIDALKIVLSKKW
jgi:putative transposase